MRFDLRFADRNGEAAFKKSSQPRLACISATVALCSFANTILTVALPIVSNNVFASSVYGRIICSAAACLIFALCSFRCCTGATIDWLDFEVLAMASLFCLAWSILLLPGVPHTFALATILMISWMCCPIRSCRSWTLPCGILILHFVATPCCLDDDIFVAIVGLVSHFGFRLQERLSRIMWNIPGVVGDVQTRNEVPLLRRCVSDADSALNVVVELPLNSVAFSTAEVTTEVGANSDANASLGQAIIIGSRRSNSSLSSSPALSAASSSDLNLPPAWPANSPTTSSSISSFVRPSTEASALQIIQRDTWPASIVSFAATSRTVTTSSQSRPSNPSQPTHSSDDQGSHSDGQLLSGLLSSNISSHSPQGDRLFSYDSLASLKYSDIFSDQRIGSNDHTTRPGAEQMAERIASLETSLRELHAALVASRYVSALSCTAVLGVSSILFDNQREMFQREIAHVRDLAAWEARKAAIAEQSRYATKLQALKARDIISASANNGRPDQSRRNRNGSSFEGMDGVWELIDSGTRPDAYLRILVISGDRITDGCGQKSKLHHKVTFEGRELLIEDGQLVRVGNHGKLMYRRRTSGATR